MTREQDDLRRRGIVWVAFVLLLAGIHFSFHYSGDDLKLLNQTFGELVEKRWQDSGRVLTDASGMGELFPAFQAMETVGHCSYRRNRGDAQVSVYGEKQ